jgi:hypothetical protein
MYPEGDREVPLCTSDLPAIMADNDEYAKMTFGIIRQGFALKAADTITKIEDERGEDEEPDPTW